MLVVQLWKRVGGGFGVLPNMTRTNPTLTEAPGWAFGSRQQIDDRVGAESASELHECSYGGIAGLASALEMVCSRTAQLLKTWISAGKIVFEFSSEEIVWELIALLATVRLLYLNHQAIPSI